MFNWIKELIELKQISRINKLDYDLKMRNIEREEQLRIDELNREANVCESCEVLKHELEVVRLENNRLLDRILMVPKAETPIDTSNLQPILPKKHLPFTARRQMLEQESRHTAQLMQQAREEGRVAGMQAVKDTLKNNPPAKDTEVDDLEKELDLASAAREAEAKTN